MQTVDGELQRLKNLRGAVRYKGQGWNMMKRHVNNVTYSPLHQLHEQIYFRDNKP